MSTPMSLNELAKLFNNDSVSSQKIECIRIIRAITGSPLREAKDFFDHIVHPAIFKAGGINSVVGRSVSNHDGRETDVELAPPMFLIGHSYRQLDKNVVLIIGASNQNNPYETVYSINTEGDLIHRYNRRDFGRVTGTDSNHPDPRNLERIDS